MLLSLELFQKSTHLHAIAPKQEFRERVCVCVGGAVPQSFKNYISRILLFNIVIEGCVNVSCSQNLVFHTSEFSDCRQERESRIH